MEDIIKLMEELGFSQNEAKVYLALILKNPLSGYEVAKNAGITRTMVYDILNRLVQKNAVIEIEANGKLYSPVPYKELFRRYKDGYLEKLSMLEKEISKMESNSKTASYLINITDYEEMLKEIKHLIDEARESIYLSIWEQEAVNFKDDLEKAYKRGVKIISFSFGQLPYNFGEIYQYGIPKEALKGIWNRRRIVIVVDRERILIGEGNEEIEEISVITSNTMLIELAIDEITLDIFHLQILKREGIFPSQIVSKEDYVDNCAKFYYQLGIDFDKMPHRVDE